MLAELTSPPSSVHACFLLLIFFLAPLQLPFPSLSLQTDPLPTQICPLSLMAATTGAPISVPSDLAGPCSSANSAQASSLSASSPSSSSKSCSQFSFNFMRNSSLFSRISFRKGRNGFRTGVPESHRPVITPSIAHRNQDFVRASALNENGKAAGSPLVICFGEMLIDFVPTVGGLSLADAPAFKKAPGGAPANVAVGISRLGGRSAFIGKVGDDEFGHMLADILRQNNVEDEGILFDKGARTALAFVTLRSDGEREFMFFRNPSADMLLHEKELNVGLIKKASIFHYGSISLITEPCKSAHLAAMKIAKETGALLSYDPNLRLPLWPSAEEARKGILSIWNEADIIKISEEEMSFLTEGGDPYSDEAAQKLMHPNLKLLLVTEGQDGCRYYTKGLSGRVAGVKVDTIDTTGAGDAFVAGMLSQLVHDLTLIEDEKRLREALHFANHCGAIATTERGAIPALPDRQTVLNAISKVPA